MIVPILFAVYMSFHDWSGIGPMKFIGFGNFVKLLTDPRISKIFLNALGNNLKFTVCVLTIILTVQLVFAYLLHIKIRGSKYFQLVIFLPYVISTAIIGFFTLIVFDPNLGILNNLLGLLGRTDLKSAWFGNPKISFALLVMVILWQSVGAGMMIFYANMKDIPRSVIEASVIDGAGEWTRFTRIVMPLLAPSFTTNIILGVIWSLTIFDIPFLIGGPQGGINNSIDFANQFFYRSSFGSAYFGETSLGFGASISVVMFLIIFSVSMILSKLLKRFKSNDD
jgi:ABC-type sugar transport system permease subunit